MNYSQFRLFGLNSSKEFARSVSTEMGIPLSRHEEKWFEDGEPYVRSSENVRGCDVYVIQSLYTDEHESVSDKFAKLLFFIGSLKDASARRISVVVPYLSFARSDRKTTSRAPILTKYTAQLLEAMGCDRLLTMDVHNLSAFQNAFRIQTDNLEAKNLFVSHLVTQMNKNHNYAVLSPDSGGMSRARHFRNSLSTKFGKDVGLAYLDKNRDENMVYGNYIVGDVKDKKVIILDDMIGSGSTIRECAKAVKANNGTILAACATHGLFVGKADLHLETVESVIITDTVSSLWRLKENQHKIRVISTAAMFAQAIKITFEEGGSISNLLK